jgi:hypothetical protein
MTLTGGELDGARLDAELMFPAASSRSSRSGVPRCR